MIYYIETMMGGDNHIMVNSSMAEILLQKDDITFVGNQQQYIKICSILNTKNIKLKKIKTQGSPRLYFLPFFVVYHTFIYLKYLFIADKKRDLIYVSSIFPVTHLLLRLQKKIFSRKKLLIALHGEVEFTQQNKKPILRVLGKFLKKALFLNCDAKTMYLVFGESIRQNIISSHLLTPKNTIAIDHPYSYTLSYNPNQKKKQDEPVKFGSAGVASIQKNSHLIFELAKLCKADQVSQHTEFILAGRIMPEIEPFINEHVLQDDSTAFLPQAAYEQKIADLDYILFFYDNNYYKFTASGAFFDAIKFQKPIIALKNDYINYYFEKLGNIGYLCNNVQEMAVVVKNIAQGHGANNLRFQKEALANALNQLSTDKIADDFFAKTKLFF